MNCKDLSPDEYWNRIIKGIKNKTIEGENKDILPYKIIAAKWKIEEEDEETIEIFVDIEVCLENNEFVGFYKEYKSFKRKEPHVDSGLKKTYHKGKRIKDCKDYISLTGDEKENTIENHIDYFLHLIEDKLYWKQEGIIMS